MVVFYLKNMIENCLCSWTCPKITLCLALLLKQSNISEPKSTIKLAIKLATCLLGRCCFLWISLSGPNSWICFKVGQLLKCISIYFSASRLELLLQPNTGIYISYMQDWCICFFKFSQIQSLSRVVDLIKIVYKLIKTGNRISKDLILVDSNLTSQ